MALVPLPGQTPPARPPAAEPETRIVPVPGAGGGQPPPPPEDDFPDEESALGGRMSFLDHLDEFRRRITQAILGLLVGFLVAFAFIERIAAFVFARLTAEVPGGHLIFTDPTEAFFIYIKLAALTGLVIASPWVMWQVWLFIAPGLYSKEKRLAIPFVFFASSLFASGVAFSHYVLFPAAWRFFSSFSNDFMTFTPRIEPVFGLYIKLALALGLVFQMPMLVFVLARLGIVTAGFLLKNLKYAILIIFIVAAVVTPDGSMVVQVIMAAPMIVLYFLSIGVAWAFGKSKMPDPEDDVAI
ncbi:MAG: twin-arginine translocase subunit TatC [Vicinamibacterales bacterium]